MIWRFILLISLFVGFLSISFESSANSFTPGPSIAMTGSSDQVFFDVADDIANNGATTSPPKFLTTTKTFSGAFYLSGAGWVLFDTGSYQVNLDCGAQYLTWLTTTCTLSGSAWGEMIGDIIFESGKVKFDPKTALLSGTMSTYIGDYSLSGIILPLIRAEFREGKTISTNHETTLTISGSSRYASSAPWIFSFQPTGYTPALYSSLLSIDLSHASDYSVDITDPNGSTTTITDFKVVPGIPDTTLNAAASSTIHAAFCTIYPTDPLCPDSAILEPMTLDKQPSAGIVVANGVDSYNFRLRIRDQYGNATSGGSIYIEYEDAVSEIQAPDVFPYMSLWSGNAIISSGSIISTGPTLYYSGIIIGDINYGFASLAPTDAINSLSLSGILYTYSGVTTDVSTPAMRASLIFSPWYSSSLSIVWDIIVWSGVEFTWALTHISTISEPTATSVYHIQIGSNNTSSSFENFVWNTIACAKYISPSIGVNECNWLLDPVTFIDPVVVSTTTPISAFSGVYTPIISDPPLEAVSYKSYITYLTGSVRVMYPSQPMTTLGWAKYGISPLLILGQNNAWDQYNGIKTSSARSDFWNTLHKAITLLSRNRTTYSDVDYIVSTWSITVNNNSFTSKRSLIAIGADITVVQNIDKRNHPLSIIALTDTNGNGGNIHIADSVTDIESSLFAEHSVASSGSHQLYIHGSLISANTTGDTLAWICPYYVSLCIDPAQYDLEKLRAWYLTDLLPANAATSTTAASHPWDALIIEYDGRVLSDPPPGLSKK